VGKKESQRRGRKADEKRRKGTSSPGTHPSKRKMSVVLEDIAEPLLDGLTLPDHADGYRLGLMIAAAIWNATRHRNNSERVRSFEDAWKRLGRLKSEDLRQRMQGVYDRAMERYPLHVESRAIAVVDLSIERDGRYRINVASIGK
jgi:hypothetical protein